MKLCENASRLRQLTLSPVRSGRLPRPGELGRLMREYIYWSLRESQGWALVGRPMWDKPAWDDRGSWFKAPSLRTVVDVGVAVTATVLSGGTALPAVLGAAAINLADDAVFTMLDVAGGHKSWHIAEHGFHT